jgi:hypothetical protein
MNYTTWQETLEEADVPVEGDPLSVYRAFEQVADGRHKRGVRYSVALILTLIVLAKLAGMTTTLAIAEWVRLRAGWLSKVLPGTRKYFPCASTYSKVLRTLDAAQVNEVVTQLLTRARAVKRCGDEPSRLVGQAEREEHVHVALDGKTLRGTLGHEAADQRKMHQLALYETRTGLVLKEQVVGEKENELSIVSQFLSPVWVKGRIIESRMPCTPNARLSRRCHARRRLLLARSPRAISPCYVTTCSSSSVNRLSTAGTGARRGPVTKAMDDWRPVPNSTSFWRTSGRGSRRSFDSCGP